MGSVSSSMLKSKETVELKSWPDPQKPCYKLLLNCPTKITQGSFQKYFEDV